jgi:hypothetical protein
MIAYDCIRVNIEKFVCDVIEELHLPEKTCDRFTYGKLDRHPNVTSSFIGMSLPASGQLVTEFEVAYDGAENIVAKAFEKGALFLICGKSSIRLSLR